MSSLLISLAWNLLHLALLIALPLSQIAWGRALYSLPVSLTVSFFVGLSAQLFVIVALGAVFFATPWGLELAADSYKLFWALATLILLLPCLFRPNVSRPCFLCSFRCREFLAPLRVIVSPETSPLSVNACLWFAVTLLLGCTLFGSGFDASYSPGRSISTIWVNNFSDLPFHLGMISGFLVGGNFPPEYQVYAGTPLSYPFFINLWTALLAWPSGSLFPLPVIFLFQWMILWWIVFRALSAPGLSLGPWAVLFGGGTVYTFQRLFTAPLLTKALPAENALSHFFIDKGEPWTVFLSTLWIPQRALLFGVAVLLVGLSVLLDEKSPTATRVMTATGLFSLSLLAHTHAMLIALLFTGLYVVYQSIQSQQWSLGKNFLLGLTPAFLSLPFLVGKQGIVKLVPGWYSLGVLGSGQLWLTNAPLLLLGLSVLCVARATRLIGLILLLIFLFGNSLQLAIWNWDQIKVFVVLYVLVVYSLRFLVLTNFARALVQLAMLVAIIPGLSEAGIIIAHWRSYTVYSTAQLLQAAQIEQAAELHTVVIDKPIHNSPVTLAGRSLFCGYDGTLYSHGIDYKERQKVNETVLNETVLSASNSEATIIDYLNRTPSLKGRPVLTATSLLSK